MGYDYCGEEDKSLSLYHDWTLSLLGQTKKTPMNLESMFGGRYAACHKPVLLIFNRSCTDGNVWKQVGEVSVVFRVEHFVGAGEVVITQSRQMKLTNGNDALVHIGLFVWVGLMEHPLVAVACRSRLVCAYAGDDNYLISHLLLYSSKAGNIFKNGLALICGAGADDKNELIGASVKNCAYLTVACCFDLSFYR